MYNRISSKYQIIQDIKMFNSIISRNFNNNYTMEEMYMIKFNNNHSKNNRYHNALVMNKQSQINNNNNNKWIIKFNKKKIMIK